MTLNAVPMFRVLYMTGRWAQVVLTLGIVVAQAINIGTQHIPHYGWRISLACAGLPAVVLTLGGLLLPETPNSLIERGFEEQGKQVPFSAWRQL